jgi:hypothetical protein
LINLGRVSVVRAGVVSADISLDEERGIAEKASEVLSSLGPLSPRNAEKLSVLSKAIFTATNKASLNLYSRDETLSPARREAAATLDVIYELLGRGRLPQGVINQAKVAVDAWLKALTRAR